MTYHPGKVLKVIEGKKGKDSSGEIIATVEMWDDNLFTMNVENSIQKEIKEGSVVLVDYSPREGLNVPVPKQNIVRVLDGNLGEDVWKAYKEFHAKRSRKPQTMPVQAPSYMG